VLLENEFSAGRNHICFRFSSDPEVDFGDLVPPPRWFTFLVRSPIPGDTGLFPSGLDNFQAIEV